MNILPITNQQTLEKTNFNGCTVKLSGKLLKKDVHASKQLSEILENNLPIKNFCERYNGNVVCEAIKNKYNDNISMYTTIFYQVPNESSAKKVIRKLLGMQQTISISEDSKNIPGLVTQLQQSLQKEDSIIYHYLNIVENALKNK